MTDLIELTSIINRQKVKHLDLWNGRENDSNKILMLYEAILDNKFDQDLDPVEYLYGTDRNGELKFTKLKSRLRKRLTNALFSIDLNDPSYKEFQKAYYNCYKDWSAVRILLGKGARSAAISTTHRILQKAIKFEFNYLALESARILRVHYCLYDKNYQKYNKYKELIKQYQKSLRLELMADQYYLEMKALSNFPKAEKPNIAKQAKKYAKELKKKSKGLGGYQLNFRIHQINVYCHEMANENKKMMRACEKAIAFFQDNKFQGAKNAISIFQNKYLACCIQLKRFKEGEIILKENIETYLEGSGRWFAAHRLYIYLCFHTQRFEEAYTLFSKLYEHKTFNRQINNEKDVWKTFEVYVNYFNSFFEFDANKKTSRKKFRLNKYLNEVPVYSKNKRAKNIPILIIHILFLLQQKKYDKVIDRLDALNQYSYRYLRDDESFRSNCFIKMLIQLPRAHFHKQGVIRKADKYFQKLKGRPIQISEQSDEIEIVPYEILWEFVLKSLDNKFH